MKIHREIYIYNIVCENISLYIYIYTHVTYRYTYSVYIYIHMHVCIICSPVLVTSPALSGQDNTFDELKLWAEQNREWSESGPHSGVREPERRLRVAVHRFQRSYSNEARKLFLGIFLVELLLILVH